MVQFNCERAATHRTRHSILELASHTKQLHGVANSVDVALSTGNVTRYETFDLGRAALELMYRGLGMYGATTVG